MKTKLYLFSILGALLLASCYDETPNPAHFQKNIEFFATINDASVRATDASWDSNDAIGIFMIRSGNGLNSTALADNIKYTTVDGSGTFTPVDPSKAITFPYNGTKVDFIAYYPYKSSFSSYLYPIALTDQSKQSALDLMYSNNMTGLDNSSPYVSLNFKHQLVKIIINITSSKPAYNLTGMKVKITNLSTNANFSLADGTLTPTSAIGNISCNVSADGKTAQAILLPESSLSDKTIQLVVGEDSYTFALNNAPDITSFERGKKYTFHLTINPIQGNTAQLTNTSITNWIDAPAQNISKDQDNTPFKGSQSNPYSVAEGIMNQGEKNVWLKAYIVGYYSGTSYTSFVNNATDVEKITNIALAENPNETDASKTFSVNLTSGAIQAALNLKDHPENLGKTVTLNGDLETYLGILGIKNIKNYTLAP